MSRHAVLLVSITVLSCQAGALSKRDPGGGTARDGGGDSEPPGFGFSPVDGGGPPMGVGPLGPGSEQCAEEAIGAEVTPLDLALVLDASGSMRAVVDGKTRWAWVVEALTSFVSDPRSAGLGVGLQVFPFTIVAKPCKTDEDCGMASPSPNYWCTQPYVCADPAVPVAMAKPCDPNDAFCPMGVKCLQAGRCAGNGERCLNLGQACPGGGGQCSTTGTVCKFQIDSCEPADYQRPRVPIATLPAAAAPLVQGLTSVTPGGNTPIGPAFDGAVMNLRQHLTANPGHRAALVVASDGGPTGCPNNDVGAVAMRFAAARGATPSLPTYVIGVLQGTASSQPLNDLAVAGGTGKPFIVNASANLGQGFLDTLNQIRSLALPCEFVIPKPSKGDIDFQRVNVRYMGPAGPADLFYVGSADKCDPMQGGWYYDVPPTSGTPTRIRVCDATCGRFKAELGGKVELRFGCQTRIK